MVEAWVMIGVQLWIIGLLLMEEGFDENSMS